MIKINDKCILAVWDSEKQENIYICGKIVDEVSGDVGEDFDRYDVQTDFGLFRGCHPDCIKIV